MGITIRQEKKRDYTTVHNLIKAAFANMQESDHKEHLLVERLRRSDAFIPELSLVAETQNGTIVGYILLTKVEIASAEKKVLGHKDYYPRFGYKKAIDYDIRFPFDVPPEFCMVKELAPNSLNGVHGVVQYASEFTE